MIREIPSHGAPGLPVLGLHLLSLAGTAATLIWSATSENMAVVILCLFGGAVLLIAFGGYFIVNPNQAKVLLLFGDYRGSAKIAGLRFTNPFYSKRNITLRIRNFETPKLKVNDNRGNPIEIASIVVWRVTDTAEACFEVDNVENYVHVQSESAVRNLATHYPYDAHAENEVALSSHTSEISAKLGTEIRDRLLRAGVEILEARVSHLAYAPEIASAMLRRQQAVAVIAARQKIVEGAVGMVEHALALLSQKKVLTLDEDRKATMVSNLLVVLCSEQATQPVLNTGTLYS